MISEKGLRKNLERRPTSVILLELLERGLSDADAVSLMSVRQRSSPAMRFAERVLHGLDDDGSRQEIVIWIERRPGAVWAVGRAINPRNRSIPEPLPEDYVFEGFELEDALEAANAALSDDRAVSAEEGVDEEPPPFVAEELLRPLERWFFGHPQT